MIVLDASAAVSALLRSGDARRVLGHEQVHVPHLIDSEVAHALRRRVAARELHEQHGLAALGTWQRLGIVRHGVVALLGRVWELRYNLSAYDASYVALAERLGCSLITADRRISQAPGVGCSITVVPR